jgi:hypothetical protein
MILSVSADFITRMGQLARYPRVKFTSELFLPSWSEEVAASELAYASGHGCAVMVDGVEAGEDVLFRARVSTDGVLYVAAIAEDDLEDPETWEALFVSSGITGLVRPDWIGNTAPDQGAMLEVVAGPTYFHVFAFLQVGELWEYQFDTSGTLHSSAKVANVDIDSSMQIAACKHNELFLLRITLVEESQSAWQLDVYGSDVWRYVNSGGWAKDSNPFLFCTHARGDLVHDDYRCDSSADIEAQWGYRPHGGLAAFNIDDDTALVVIGMRYFFRKAYYTHTQAVMGFIYHRDNGIWERSFDNDDADYDDENRLWLTVHCASSQIDDRLLLSFVRLTEPSDFEQTAGEENIPRHLETVAARISSDGRFITQFQHVGSAADYAHVRFVAINHGGIKTLWAIAAEAISKSEPAHWMCDVPARQRFDMALVTNNFSTSRTNAWSMDISTKMVNASLVEVSDLLKPGRMLRVWYGEWLSTELGIEYMQLGQAYIDSASPVFNMAQRSDSGTLVGRAELQLLDTRAEVIDDKFPLQELFCLPEESAGTQTYTAFMQDKEVNWSFPQQLIIKQGWWTMVKPKWPTLFFAGNYPDLESGDRLVCAMESTPFAFTGGGPVDLAPGIPGGPGDIADDRKNAKAGSMFNDVSWTILEPAVDGCISAVGRFGDNTGQANFSFRALTGCEVNTKIVRSNGLITHIEWFSDDCGSPPGDEWGDNQWNDTWQESCMFGLVCRAVHDDLDEKGNGKKYMFIWEAQSDWAKGSHLEDQWGRFGEAFDKADWGALNSGKNKLYLYISDFDETNENWKADGNWIHRAVAGGITATGLTPGLPAELRLQIYGGTIYCFYRPYGTGNYPKNVAWHHAITHNSAHFGAGKRGLVARGGSTIQWDVLYPGKNVIDRCDNVVHVWDVVDTDGVKDPTFREIITGYAWQGLTETQYRNLVAETAINHLADTFEAIAASFVENPVIDFKLTIALNGGEAGLFLRSIDGSMDNCVSIGLVVNSTYKDGDNVLECYVVKRRYSDGVEDLAGRDFAPSLHHLKPEVPYRCRISVRNNLYTIWCEGAYLGHFLDDTELGSRWGTFASGSAATFDFVELTELHMVPEHALLDPSQTMKDGIDKFIGQRAIKGVFKPTGEVLVSHFADHDDGPDLEASLKQGARNDTNKFASAVAVQGAETRATYQSPKLLVRGRHFQEFNFPDLMTSEDCYEEAKAICRRMAEDIIKLQLLALSDARLEPEDRVNVVISEEGTNGTFLIDGLKYDFELKQIGQESLNEMGLEVRQQYIL